MSLELIQKHLKDIANLALLLKHDTEEYLKACCFFKEEIVFNKNNYNSVWEKMSHDRNLSIVNRLGEL